MARTVERDEATVERNEDDTEGHSLSLVMGIDAMRRSADRERKRAARVADEELTPLTKTFPRLKGDRRA